jgi:hypothetical protein
LHAKKRPLWAGMKISDSLQRVDAKAT